MPGPFREALPYADFRVQSCFGGWQGAKGNSERQSEHSVQSCRAAQHRPILSASAGQPSVLQPLHPCSQDLCLMHSI